MAKTTKLYTREDLSDWIFVKYTDARMPVEFVGKLERHFIGTAKRGKPWECLLVLLIEAAARNDPSLFPHKVLHAYVIGSTVFIITRKPKRARELIAAVRYKHNFTRLVRKFDTFSKARFMRQFGEEGVTIKLSPHGVDRRAGHGQRDRTPSREDGSRTPRILRGAERRARDAGLIPPTVA